MRKHFQFNLSLYFQNKLVIKMGQEVLTFMFAWIFSTVLIDESETSKS